MRIVTVSSGEPEDIDSARKERRRLQVAAAVRRWRAKNPGYARAYLEANPGYYRGWQERTGYKSTEAVRRHRAKAAGATWLGGRRV